MLNQIEKAIHIATTQEPRDFTEEEKQYLLNNENYRKDMLFWFESNNSDGCWTKATVEFMNKLYTFKVENRVESKREIMNLETIKTNNQRRRELKNSTTPGLWYCRGTDDDDLTCAQYVGLNPSPNCKTAYEWEHDQRQGLACGSEEQEDAEKVIAITLLQSPPLARVKEFDENTEFIAFSHNDCVENEVGWLLQKVEAQSTALEDLKTLRDDLDGYLSGEWTGNEGFESMREGIESAITALEG